MGSNSDYNNRTETAALSWDPLEMEYKNHKQLQSRQYGQQFRQNSFSSRPSSSRFSARNGFSNVNAVKNGNLATGPGLRNNGNWTNTADMREIKKLVHSGMRYDETRQQTLQQKNIAQSNSEAGKRKGEPIHILEPKKLTVTPPSTEVNGIAVKVTLIPLKFPEDLLNMKEYKEIETALMCEIMKLTENGPQVRFLSSEFKEGRMIITCADLVTKEWLSTVLEKIKPKGKELELVDGDGIPKRSVAVAHFPIVFPAAEILKILKTQNKKLPIKNWKVLQNLSVDNGISLVLSLDATSVKLLAELNNLPYFGLGLVRFRIAHSADETATTNDEDTEPKRNISEPLLPDQNGLLTNGGSSVEEHKTLEQTSSAIEKDAVPKKDRSPSPKPRSPTPKASSPPPKACSPPTEASSNPTKASSPPPKASSPSPNEIPPSAKPTSPSPKGEANSPASSNTQPATDIGKKKDQTGNALNKVQTPPIVILPIRRWPPNVRTKKGLALATLRSSLRK